MTLNLHQKLPWKVGDRIARPAVAPERQQLQKSSHNRTTRSSSWAIAATEKLTQKTINCLIPLHLPWPLGVQSPTASACVYKWINIAEVGLEWLYLLCIKRSHARQLSGVFPLRFLVLISVCVCVCVCGWRTTTASDRQVGGEVTSCFHFTLIYKHPGFSSNGKKKKCLTWVVPSLQMFLLFIIHPLL